MKEQIKPDPISIIKKATERVYAKEAPEPESEEETPQPVTVEAPEPESVEVATLPDTVEEEVPLPEPVEADKLEAVYQAPPLDEEQEEEETEEISTRQSPAYEKIRARFYS